LDDQRDEHLVTAALASVATYSFTPALSVVDLPEDVSGFGNTGAAANITTGLVVATPTGGYTPYTYSWAQTSTSPYTWVINSAATASTSFTCNALGPGTTAEATFECTVTDAAGKTAKATVSAFANNGQPYDNRLDRRNFIGGDIF
jgi:hypothetical protein